MVSMVEGMHELERHDQPAAEQVHFCRKFVRPPKPCDLPGVLLGKKASRRTIDVVVRVSCAVVGGVWGSYLLYAERLVAPWPTLVIVLFTISLYSYWIFGRRRFTHKLKQGDVPKLPPAGARLLCVGSPDDLPPLSNSRAVMFEPRVFRVPYTAKGTGLQTVLIFLAVAGFFLSRPLGWEGLGNASLLVLLATTLFTWLRPAYFRISPGRLEVLRYGFLRRAPVKVEEYDLRRVYVVANLLRRDLSISRSERKWRDFSLPLMPEWRDFLHTLFMAALCEQQAPPLPVDTL